MAAAPPLSRQTSSDLGRQGVDLHLASIRLRVLDEVVDVLGDVCSEITVWRVARSGGIVIRLLLNLMVALRSLVASTSPKRARVRALALTELAYLAASLVIIARKVRPLLTPKRQVMFRDWRGAAEALDAVRPLASYSLLAHITRIQFLLPGTWAVVSRGLAAQPSQRAAAPSGEAAGHASPRPAVGDQLRDFCAVALRGLCFAGGEAAVIFLGLLSLRQKMEEVHYITPKTLLPGRFRRFNSLAVRALRWVPFLGFANQVTGVVDQEDLRMDAVWRVAFAPTRPEDESCDGPALGDFNAILLQELCHRRGLVRGILLYLSLSSADYQALLISQSADAGCSPTAAGGAAGIRCASHEMVVGQVLILAQHLRRRNSGSLL